MFRKRQSRVAGAVAIALVIGGGAHATPVTLSGSFIQLDNIGPNDIGIPTGFNLFLGTTVPTALAGPSTTATLSTTNTLTGQPVLHNLPFEGATTDPGLFDAVIPDGPGLHGPWTLTFSNGGDVTTQVVSLPAGATQLPPITNLTVSGSPANPTFNWLPPAGRPVEGYAINLFDQDLLNKSGTFVDTVLSDKTTASQFTVPTDLAEGLILDPNHRYSLSISALETRDGTANLNNANVDARSPTYFDFTPASVGGPTFTYLPVINAGVFDYDVTNIASGTTIFVDPQVAIGYAYATGVGNPNFRSVVLPKDIGDGLYDICGRNASGQRILLAKDWPGGDLFDFGAAGVDRFEVLGIAPGAKLDPSDTIAFVTGLSFVSSGDFTGTQTPITANTSVPEPPAGLLLAVGIIGLFGMRRLSCRRSADDLYAGAPTPHRD